MHVDMECKFKFTCWYKWINRFQINRLFHHMILIRENVFIVHWYHLFDLLNACIISKEYGKHVHTRSVICTDLMTQKQINNCNTDSQWNQRVCLRLYASSIFFVPNQYEMYREIWVYIDIKLNILRRDDNFVPYEYNVSPQPTTINLP